MIKFKNINGDVFLAVGSIKRKSALNGEKSLTGTLFEGDDVLNKIDKGWSLEFDNEPYVVTYFERNDNDNTVEFDAIHKFFWDMTKDVLYFSWSGSHTAKAYLDQIFDGTGYTYALNFEPSAFEKDNWGMKNKLSLFNDVIDSMGGEFEINGTLVSIFKNIGSDLSTIVRHGFNLSDMSLENDNTDFVTYGEGFGAYADQESQTGERLHVTYTSPLAKTFGKLHAEPIDDQRYMIKDNLLQAIKDKVDGSFAISIKLSLYDLTAAGYPYKMANVGDWLLAIDENLDFKQKIRIISVDDEFATDGTRISYTVTCGDIGVVQKYQQANASLGKKVDSAYQNAQDAKESSIQAVIAANGKNTNYWFDSKEEMDAFKANEGDMAILRTGDGEAMYFYMKMPDGSFEWVKRVDPDTGEQIAAGVDDAVTQANTHTDEVKQGLSTDIATAKSQAASQASTAEANAKSAATSQFTQAQSALSAAKSDLTNSIASEASARNAAVAAANSQAQTYANQAKADAMSAASSADGVIRTAISSSANSLSSTITQNKSSADSGISTAQTTAQQAVDGLETKVSQTDYNAKTGQLQTDLTATTQTANQAKTDIVSIKQKDGEQDAKMNTIVSDASGTKQTVSDLQTAQGKQSGDISTLQQRADGFDATVDKINTTVNSLGQINQLFNTEFNPDLACWTQVSTSYRTTGATRYGSTILKVVSDDGNYLYQDIPVSSGAVSFSSIMQLDDGFSGNFRFGINFRDNNYAYVSAGGTTWGNNNTTAMGYTLQKVENISVPAGASYVRINYQFRGTGVGRIIQPMLVFSDHVGTYVQGNYNNNSATAKAQLTADQATLSINDYKTDADGRIRQSQADIKANADSITKKVSQTDYDQKTGDLSTKLNNTTDTANNTKQELSDYKEYANGNISGVSTNLDKLAGKVDLKLTKTDYDNDQSILNTSLSQWKADYDGWTGTVSKLSTTVNNLGQVNQLFNTEFSPDFQSWTQVSTAYCTTGNTRNGSNVVKVVGDDGDYLYQDVAVSAGVVSFSSFMQVDDGLSGNFRFGINFRDSSHALVSGSTTYWGKNNTSALNYTLQKVENIAVPSGAAYVRINYQFRGTGVARFFQPMLVFSPTVGTYVQGNYNNNAALAQVKITADSIFNFVRDSSGNISSDFQTALSKTSIITGSTLASSIQQQTSSQITQALTDNNGKIISLINQDTSGVQIAGKNLAITADTTVDGNFWAKQVNAVQVNASNITVGTLNGSQVNITNINASNIITGTLTGITLMSSANGSQFKVQGNNLQMVKQNGDNLQLSTDGLFWKDSSGNVLFEASNKITTSDIFGTAEYNVYLASLNETRSVTYATALTGSGGVSDYNYVPHRAGGIYTTWVEVNASGGAENVYIRPLTAQSEARITASGGTDSYANLRARYIYANRIGINSRTYAQQLYLQTGDEVRVKSTNDDVENSAYKAIRASAFNSASLAEYKQNIDVSSISGLDEINKSTIYNYQLKTSPDKQEVGLVIGDGYDISQIVIDGDGVNQYRMVALAWKAIQELTQRINTLEQSLESEGK